jgi:hypothetical protein
VYFIVIVARSITSHRISCDSIALVSVVVLGGSVVTCRVLMRLAHGSSTLYFIDFSTTVLVL